MRRVLVYSIHALARMDERAISRGEVQAALASRETTYPAEDDDTCLVILGQTSEGRRLKVIVEAIDQNYVITAADRDVEA